MDIRRYWRALKRRAWVLIVLVVATTLTAGALTYLSTPEYVATATVEARVTSGSGAPAPTQILSLPEAVASHKLGMAVTNELNLKESPTELKRRVRVTSGHSDLYTIAVTDPNPEQAIAIANSVARRAVQIFQQENASANTTVFEQDAATHRLALLQRFETAERDLLEFQAANRDAAHSADIALQTRYQELLLDQQAAASAYQSFVANSTNSVLTAMAEATHFTASVLDPALATPDLTSRYLKVGYAALVALLLGLVLVLILEYSDNTLREPEGVEQLIGLPVVGVIPLATSQSLRQIRHGS